MEWGRSTWADTQQLQDTVNEKAGCQTVCIIGHHLCQIKAMGMYIESHRCIIALVG